MSRTSHQQLTIREVTDQLNSRLKTLNPDSTEITIVRDIILRFASNFPENTNPSKCDLWKSIAPEIIRHIFTFLPGTPAPNYRNLSRVCKSWRSALDPIWKPLVLNEAAKLGHNQVYKKEPKSWMQEYRDHVMFPDVFPTQFDWNPETGSMMMPFNGAEAHVWLGPVPAEFILQMEVSYPEYAGEVGRHGGIVFSTRNRHTRWDLTQGWSIDWIDRPSDHGYRIGLNSVNISANAWQKEVDPGKVWKFTQTKKQLLFEADGKFVYKTSNRPTFLFSC